MSDSKAPVAKCCGMIYDSLSRRSRPCTHAGKVEVDGKFYCGVHNPARTAMKDAERQARWDREREDRRLSNAVHDAERQTINASIEWWHGRIDSYALSRVVRELVDARQALEDFRSQAVAQPNPTPSEAQSTEGEPRIESAASSPVNQKSRHKKTPPNQ